MSIELEKLCPQRASLVWKGTEHIFKPFTLAARIWAAQKFATQHERNGLLVLSESVKNLELQPICEMMFWLLEDKSRFQTVDDFIAIFENEVDIFKTLLPKLVEVIGISSAEIPEDEIELKKSRGAKMQHAGRPSMISLLIGMVSKAFKSFVKIIR